MDTDASQLAAPKRRRRFQFRLRTLFVVVTIVAVACAYLAHEWRIVRDRRNWLLNHYQYPMPPSMWSIGQPESEQNPSAGPSMVRRWLGDASHDYVWVFAGFPDTDVVEAKAQFAEAQVMRVTNRKK